MKKEKLFKYEKIMISFLAIMIFITSISIGTEENVISKDNWDEWQKNEYWEWHTRETTDDKAYNGTHIVIENNVIDFYGYWKNSYKDFLYKEYTNPGKKIFKFRIDETKASYHTLDGAGFMFNANKVDNKLSGYILLFREKDICIYKINNVDIEKFETASKKTIADYGELITSKKKNDNVIHDLIVEATPTSIKVIESEEEIINVELDYSKHVGESFGLISSYLQHACSILSKIQFSQLEIMVEDYEIEILNTDLKENPISNGTFQLKDEDGKIIKEEIANENGILKIKGILPGIYSIQQTNPPDTYILNNNIYNFKVTNDGKIIDIETEEEMKLIVKNEQLKIEIYNKLIDTDYLISGSKIGLYDKEGNMVATSVTDENGKAEFVGITIGNYTYKQIECSNTFILNEESYTVDIDIDGNVTFYEKNDGIIYNTKIEEKDDNTIATKPIPNAGKKIIIITSVIITVIVSIMFAIKIKKYNF